MLTTSAEDSLGHIHDRMPLMLAPDRYDAWLDPRTGDRDDLLALLEPAAPGRLEAFPVSTLVSNVQEQRARAGRAAPASRTSEAPELMPIERHGRDAEGRRAGASYAGPSGRSRPWC